MRYAYPVIFTQTEDKKDTVLIEVPDLDILTEGYGMADAIEMARDAIGLTGISLEDKGIVIPTPRRMQDIDLSGSQFGDEGKTIVSYVDIDFKIYRDRVDNKTVRRNVTLPNWLNREAEKAQINVSRVLQEALMAKLGVYK